MDSLLKKLFGWFPPVKRTLQKIERFQQENENLEQENENRQQYIEDLKQYIANLEQENENRQQYIEDLKQYIANLKQENEVYKQQEIALKEKNTLLQQLNDQKDVRLQQLDEHRFVWSRFFFHGLPFGSNCVSDFATGADITPDETLANRIINIAKALPQKTVEGVHVWDVISRQHPKYISMLDQDHLSNLPSSPLTTGLLQGEEMTSLLHDNKQQRDHWSNAALDGLLSLCEAMELIDIENIELGARATVTEQTPDELLDAVSRLVGFEVIAPDVLVGLFGIKTKRGIFTFRHFIALYAAWRLSETFPDKKGIRIGEIGAGAGLVAYYAWQFGFRDYSIFDLPAVNILQSWFLGQSLPDAPLILADTESPFSTEGVRVLPSEFFQHVPDAYWDVVVNIDSIPEIAHDVVADYLQALRTKTRLIYSYNHEARPSLNGQEYLGKAESSEADSEHHDLKQETVSWHIGKNGGFQRTARNRSWLRPGYVEEWYMPVKPSASKRPKRKRVS